MEKSRVFQKLVSHTNKIPDLVVCAQKNSKWNERLRFPPWEFSKNWTACCLFVCLFVFPKKLFFLLLSTTDWWLRQKQAHLSLKLCNFWKTSWIFIWQTFWGAILGSCLSKFTGHVLFHISSQLVLFDVQFLNFYRGKHKGTPLSLNKWFIRIVSFCYPVKSTWDKMAIFFLGFQVSKSTSGFVNFFQLFPHIYQHIGKKIWKTQDKGWQSWISNGLFDFDMRQPESRIGIFPVCCE